MNKKVQSIALVGMMTASTLSSVGQAFAANITNSYSGISKISGSGASFDPFLLKVENKVGLDKVMNWLNDKNINMTYYRLKEVKEDTVKNTKTYQLHIFDVAGLVTYLNIEVDKDNAELTNILTGIAELQDITSIGTGIGTKSDPHKVKVGTSDGLNDLISWLIGEGYDYYRTDNVIESNGTKTYEMYGVLRDTQTTYANKTQKIYVNVVVDDNNTDVIDYLNDKNSIPVKSDSTVVTEGISEISGSGASSNPFLLKVENEVGLDKVMDWLNNKNINRTYYRLKEVKEDTTNNTETYQLHVIDVGGLVTYLNIEVDKNETKLTDRLKGIAELQDITSIGTGTGTKSDPHKVKVGTSDGLNDLILWLNAEGYDYYRTDNVIESNGTKTYEMYGVLRDTQTTYANKPQKIYVNVVVDDNNADVIDYLNNGIPVKSDSVELKELAGQTRYETAIKVSQERFTDGNANAVVLVGKDAIVDGLAAAPLANSKNAPILFADTNTITSETKEEILRVLGNNSGKTVYIVGGEAKISKSVESMLATLGVKVERLAGEDRFKTSLEVAKHLNGNSNIAFVVGGNGEADAMSISSKAAELKAPIVVVDKNNLSKEAKTLLQGKEIHVIGGTSVVSEEVERELDKLDSNNDSDRVAGLDRKETNAKVISTFYKKEDISELFIAKDGYVGGNDKLVDALAAAPLAGNNSAPIILTTDMLSETQKESLKGFNKVSKLVQVGHGISKNVITSIVELLNK